MDLNPSPSVLNSYVKHSELVPNFSVTYQIPEENYRMVVTIYIWWIQHTWVQLKFFIGAKSGHFPFCTSWPVTATTRKMTPATVDLMLECLLCQIRSATEQKCLIRVIWLVARIRMGDPIGCWDHVIIIQVELSQWEKSGSATHVMSHQEYQREVISRNHVNHDSVGHQLKLEYSSSMTVRASESNLSDLLSWCTLAGNYNCMALLQLKISCFCIFCEWIKMIKGLSPVHCPPIIHTCTIGPVNSDIWAELSKF